MLFIIPLLIGFIIENKDGLLCRIFLLFITIQAFTVFIFTYSRTGYLACAVMLFASFIFIKKYSIKIIYLLFIIYIAFFCIPDSAYMRIHTILNGSGEFIFDLPFAGSATLHTPDSAIIRLQKYSYILNEVFPFVKIIGRGVNGIGFVDGLYFKILGELGLVGIIFLLIIFRAVWRNISVTHHSNYPQIINNLFKISFIGLLVFSLFANAFIIYRILMPFICALIYLKIQSSPKIA